MLPLESVLVAGIIVGLLFVIAVVKKTGETRRGLLDARLVRLIDENRALGGTVWREYDEEGPEPVGGPHRLEREEI